MSAQGRLPRGPYQHVLLYSAGSQTPHRFCPLMIKVQSIVCGQIWACPSITIPPKVSLPVGRDPSPHMVLSLPPTILRPNRHRVQLIRYRMAHSRDEQTRSHRHIDRPCYKPVPLRTDL